MSRRTIQIDVSTDKPDTFLTLCEAVLTKHQQLGPASPFAAGDIVSMTAFADLLTRATDKRNKAQEHLASAQAAMDASRHLMGAAIGQTSITPGTLLNDLLRIKRMLLVLNSENPEALSEWGFNVVVRTARVRRRKSPPQP